MDTFHLVITNTSFTLNVIGALITIWGIAVSLVDFLKKEIFSRQEAPQSNEIIRTSWAAIWYWPWNSLLPEISSRPSLLLPGRAWVSWAS